eukprot:m.76288 g.76288  ORF g.76288 m.76288 type:complete len:159 (+) comp14019_c0_seq1:216-692(+)
MLFVIQLLDLSMCFDSPLNICRRKDAFAAPTNVVVFPHSYPSSDERGEQNKRHACSLFFFSFLLLGLSDNGNFSFVVLGSDVKVFLNRSNRVDLKKPNVHHLSTDLQNNKKKKREIYIEEDGNSSFFPLLLIFSLSLLDQNNAALLGVLKLLICSLRF